MGSRVARLCCGAYLMVLRVADKSEMGLSEICLGRYKDRIYEYMKLDKTNEQ